MQEAISYIRVSSEEQADSGLGLEAQRQRIAAYCQMKGVRLAEVFQRIVQFDNSSAGGPPSGIHRSCSVGSPILRRPCHRPIKAGEVGNKDAQKHHGLAVPGTASLSQLLAARSSLACLRFGQQLDGTVRSGLRFAADCGPATTPAGAGLGNRCQPSPSPGSRSREEEPVHEPSLSEKLLQIKGLAAPQHVVDGAAEPGRQDAQRLLLAMLLLAALLPGLDRRAAADQQTNRLGEGPRQMGVADLLAAVAQ